MRWVNDTLPPRARLRWLLMTMRLSHSSLTGLLRTEVAVGTDSEMSMFFAVAAGMPRSTVRVGSSLALTGAGRGASFGVGFSSAFGGAGVVLEAGETCGAGFAFGVGAEVLAASCWACAGALA